MGASEGSGMWTVPVFDLPRSPNGLVEAVSATTSGSAAFVLCRGKSKDGQPSQLLDINGALPTFQERQEAPAVAVPHNPTLLVSVVSTGSKVCASPRSKLTRVGILTVHL